MPCHYQDLGNTSDRSCREKYFLQPITNIRWFVGTKHAPESKDTSQNPKHFLQSKTRPRIQNTSQNPKTLPESKTRPRVQNTSLGESQKTSNNPKHIPKTKNTSKNLNASQKHFWIQERVLDSGKSFGFWDVFLDSGKCFGFWNVFLDPGKCFGFWNVFNFQLTSDARIKPAFTGREVAFDLSHNDHALVSLYVQFLPSDWSKFDR